MPPQVDPHSLVETEQESFRSLVRPASAEFLGSLFFIFLAVGSAVNTVNFQTVAATQTAISFTFGFTIFVVAFTIGHISGGHLNPAVTFSFMVVKKISWKRGVMYMGGQFSGGLLGTYLLKMWTPSSFHENCMASNVLGQDVTIGMAWGVEFILTFFLLTVVNAASDSTKSNTTLVPLAIGYAVTVCHFMAVPLTGCSINPMRSFSSAFASLGTSGCSVVWNDHWIFWTAPILGGLAGTGLYEFFFALNGGVANNLIAMYHVAAKMVTAPGEVLGRLRGKGSQVR